MLTTSETVNRARFSLRTLRAKRDGSVSILFGVSMIPLIGMIGLGVDYGIAMSNKTKLDSAADAAAVAAVTTAKSYVVDNPKDPQVIDKAIAAGIAKARTAFTVNSGRLSYAAVQLQDASVTRTGQTFNSSVTYSATLNTMFGRLFNATISTVSGTSKASTDLSSYLDFYLLVDVSGSMGLPTTQSGMTQLASQSKDMFSDYKQGCQFACHFPGNAGWGLAAGKIQLRSDAVNVAVCSLLQRASSPAVPNQYRIGIYPFINNIATLAGISSDISSLQTAAQCSQSWPLAFTNLLDTGTTQLNAFNDPTTGTGSGGTHFETAFPQIKDVMTAKNTVPATGDGSSSSAAKSFVFLITDGMQNSQNYYTWKGSTRAFPGNPSKFPGYADAWWDGSQPSQIDPTKCDTLKSSGVTISILYIPYKIISFVDNSGGIAWENRRVNSFSPTLATPLKSCASPGFFYTADTPDDITASLNQMFDQALQVTRLTQ